MVQFVGILNVTPDSFSDGGRYLDPELAVEQSRVLVASGADVIDVGAESTRPGGKALRHEEEWERLALVLTSLVNECVVSIDTRYAVTAQKAVELGVQWLNDVSGLHDEAMIDVVKSSGLPTVVMHSLTIPVDPSVVMPESCDVVQEVYRWAEAKIASLLQAGIALEQIVIDPGIGFGKTAEQSWDLIHRIDELKSLGVPLYVGHSRKSFLGGDLASRDEKTCEVSALLAKKGVDYLRVHDIAANKHAVEA